MILIFSASGDLETDKICVALTKNHYPYLRINDSDFLLGNVYIEICNNEIDPVSLFFNENRIEEAIITCVWIRKMGFFKNSPCFVKFNKIPNSDIQSFMRREYFMVHDFILDYFDNRKFFTDKDLININKLNVLREAAKLKINIPSTFISTNKIKVEIFANKKKHLLIKPISDNIGIKHDKEICILSNFILKKEEISKFPNMFFISQFQEYIDKQIELRIFYLNNQLYSMAIFSQEDKKTRIDFRNYNKESPNRLAPFILPKEISIKLICLMKKLKANAASIDMILTPGGEYYFLEINPFGIFSMIEDVCNYSLYELTANALIKHSKNAKKNN